MTLTHRICGVVLVAWMQVTADGAPATISLTSPSPYQVVQRIEFDAVLSAKQKPGNAAFGYAVVPVVAEFPKGTDKTVWEYRTTLLADATGSEVAWTKLDIRDRKATARVPAGGWYRLEVRGRDGENVAFQGSVQPIGVGEVLVVAGQSYATNCNDERMKVVEPQGRISTLNVVARTWAVAHDPQPPDGSDGGSIWPPSTCFGMNCTPIGFANVAVGATSSQWLPEGQLHSMIKAGLMLGRFRAVLWQQGESDVIAKTAKKSTSPT